MGACWIVTTPGFMSSGGGDVVTIGRGTTNVELGRDQSMGRLRLVHRRKAPKPGYA